MCFLVCSVWKNISDLNTDLLLFLGGGCTPGGGVGGRHWAGLYCQWGWRIVHLLHSFRNLNRDAPPHTSLQQLCHLKCCVHCFIYQYNCIYTLTCGWPVYSNISGFSKAAINAQWIFAYKYQHKINYSWIKPLPVTPSVSRQVDVNSYIQVSWEVFYDL